MPGIDHAAAGEMPRVPLRKAKACFSELVARAELLGEVTVLTKHGRPAAAIVPAPAGVDVADEQATLAALWTLLDRVCPPGRDPAVDDARTLLRARRPRRADMVTGAVRADAAHR